MADLHPFLALVPAAEHAPLEADAAALMAGGQTAAEAAPRFEAAHAATPVHLNACRTRGLLLAWLERVRARA